MKQNGGFCIVEYLPEEYTRHYIVEALFRLMNEHEYGKISVTDIAEKAGVGRATFYRYFKSKEEVIEFYFARNTKEFLFEQRYYPRCKADYVAIARSVFEKFQKNKDRFRLLRRARLEYLYLDFLNKKMTETFRDEYPDQSPYAPYLFAGMIFNVSMAWLDRGCTESADRIAEMFVESLNLLDEKKS